MSHVNDKQPLSGGLGAELAAKYVPEAVDLVAAIMRKPPRNALVMLKAAQLILDLAGELPEPKELPGNATPLRSPHELARIHEELRRARKGAAG